MADDDPDIEQWLDQVRGAPRAGKPVIRSAELLNKALHKELEEPLSDLDREALARARLRVLSNAKVLSNVVQMRTPTGRPASQWGFALAAGVVGIVIGLGTAELRPPSGEAELAYEYGEFVANRDGAPIASLVVESQSPREAAQQFADILVSERIPFRLWVEGASASRRIEFLMPPEVPPAISAFDSRLAALRPAARASIQFVAE